MALADTAKLVASLELQDKFSRPLGQAGAALGSFERRAGTLSRVGTQLGAGLQSAAHNLALIGVAGAGLLAVNIKAGIDSLEKLQSVETQTNAVLASTKGIAGQTADSIRNLANKYESLNALIDDKVIQSGENLLLTFTNISQKAFEPALAAALDLNQALGGGEEGLQGTIIQLGKALNDPIKGLTALRRVGVSFSADQQKQIKDLVAQNDLYGAQQVILAELTKEFGGSFAAAGQTAAGKYAKFTDAIEGAQMALSTAFLPLLGKVADRLSTFLEDPAVLARIEGFGQTLADTFDALLEAGGKLPWAAIGDSLKIAGTGAKALLDAFVSLPPWVQTAVLTGWGLNKLTGGALGNIVGTIGESLIKRVLGIQAAVVNINAATVNGVGGVPGTGPAGGAPLGLVGTLKALIPVAAAAAAVAETQRGRQQFSGINEQLAALGLTAEEINQVKRPAIAANVPVGTRLPSVGSQADIAAAIDKLRATGFQVVWKDGQVELQKIGTNQQATADAVNDAAAAQKAWGDRLTAQATAIKLAQLQTVNESRAQNAARIAAERTATEQARLTAANTAEAARWGGLAQSSLAAIAAKPPPTVNVSVRTQTNISVNSVLRSVTSAWIASSQGGGGPALDASLL